MNPAEIILGNLREDFGKLLPKGPGYLNCKVVTGYGTCWKGIVSKDIQEASRMLTKPDDFKFEMVLQVVSDFPNPGTENQLVLCVVLAVPAGIPYIFRFYEYETGGKKDEILLKKKLLFQEGIL
jgi:hypothetical protein